MGVLPGLPPWGDDAGVQLLRTFSGVLMPHGYCGYTSLTKNRGGPGPGSSGAGALSPAAAPAGPPPG